jgi:hypothetical protein
MPADRNAIGVRGESIVVNLLTRPHNAGEPFFRPQFLGDKYPTIDFFVELVGVEEGPTPFFLVQAKTTTRRPMRRNGNLPIRVSGRAMARLIRYPAPTYILGIDDQAEGGYLLAAAQNGPTELPSLPTRYPLSDAAVLSSLYDEVLHFWRSSGVTFTTSRFV